MTKPTTPEYMLRMLRQRRRLEETDTKLDSVIEKMEPMEKLRECVAWELGDSGWTDRIIRMAKDCGVKL